MEKFYYIIFIALQIFGFIIMCADKKKAQEGSYRIPEKALFLSAVFFGAIGITLAMYIVRHKTKHWYFVVFMPLLAILNIVVLKSIV